MKSRSVIFLSLVLLLILFTASVSYAATITVDTTKNEYNTGLDSCSLREAKQLANSNSDFGVCVGTSLPYGMDDIVLPAGTHTIIGASGDDTNNIGDYDISSSLNITGAGASIAESAVIKANTANDEFIPDTAVIRAVAAAPNLILSGTCNTASGYADFTLTNSGADMPGPTNVNASDGTIISVTLPNGATLNFSVTPDSSGNATVEVPAYGLTNTVSGCSPNFNVTSSCNSGTGNIEFTVTNSGAKLLTPTTVNVLGLGFIITLNNFGIGDILNIFATPDAVGSATLSIPAYSVTKTHTGCAPDLTATKTNDVSGSASRGDANDGAWTWSILIDNTGPVSAVFASGQKIIVDNLPAGPTYGIPSCGSFSGVTGTILCAIVANVLTCTASGGNFTINSGGSCVVSFTVTPASTGAHVNPSTTCEVDPDLNVDESDNSNNSCADTVTVSAPDLSISKANNVGNASSLGDINDGAWTWSLTLGNGGLGEAVFTDGETILSDQLPTTNIAYGTPFVGSVTNITNTGNISCLITAGLLTCTASGANVTVGGSTGTFTVSFTATPSASGTYTNPTGGSCSVDPDSNVTESNEANNTCSSNSVVVSAPDLTISKANNVSGATSLGDVNDGAWTWSLTAGNGGSGDAVFIDGETIISDQLPTTNISYGPVSVGSVTNVTNSGNISCSINGSGLLTCTASGADVTVEALTGTFTVSFTATPSATGTFVNPTGGSCSVDPAGNLTESNEGNNLCADTVEVSARVTKYAAPAISTWGMIIFALLAVAASVFYLRRRIGRGGTDGLGVG